jgi:hypothetical protein
VADAEEDEEVEVREADEEEERENPLTAYLRSLDMSAEEMFLSNVLVGLVGAAAFVFLHTQLLSLLDKHMRKKNPDFTPPSMLMFPAPEIILFIMYYNGILQTSLIIVVAPCVSAGWRAFGALVCAGVVGAIVLMMIKIRGILSKGHVHAGEVKGVAGGVNPHVEFEHK